MTSYDKMRKIMGLKSPGKRTLARRAAKRQTDNLGDDEIAAINAQMGMGGEDEPRRRRRRGGIGGTIRDAIDRQQGLGG